jgi:hypothetical protein
MYVIYGYFVIHDLFNRWLKSLAVIRAFIDCMDILSSRNFYSLVEIPGWLFLANVYTSGDIPGQVFYSCFFKAFLECDQNCTRR